MTVQTTTTWKDDAARDLVLNSGERYAMLVRGEGADLWDDEGTRYLDFLGGIAVISLGHAHPVFVQAVADQALRDFEVQMGLVTPETGKVAETSKELGPAVKQPATQK